MSLAEKSFNTSVFPYVQITFHPFVVHVVFGNIMVRSTESVVEYSDFIPPIVAYNGVWSTLTPIPDDTRVAISRVPSK